MRASLIIFICFVTLTVLGFSFLHPNDSVSIFRGIKIPAPIMTLWIAIRFVRHCLESEKL